MKINIDEIRQAESTLEDINEEIREARFHDDKEREEFMLKEKRETLKILALAEKEKHATHTPGPWQISCIDGIEDSLMVGGGDDGSDIVADIRDEKDARLIAAAPEMFETMKEIVAVVNDAGPILGTAIGDKLREVLAKVDGGEG